jgi:hypothetical protein
VTKSEMALLLGKAAAFDQRTVGESDIEAWHECIGDLDFKEAMSAVTNHYRYSTDRLMPAHLAPSLHPDAGRWD